MATSDCARVWSDYVFAAGTVPAPSLRFTAGLLHHTFLLHNVRNCVAKKHKKVGDSPYKVGAATTNGKHARGPAGVRPCGLRPPCAAARGRAPRRSSAWPRSSLLSPLLSRLVQRPLRCASRSEGEEGRWSGGAAEGSPPLPACSCRRGLSWAPAACPAAKTTTRRAAAAPTATTTFATHTTLAPRTSSCIRVAPPRRGVIAACDPPRRQWQRSRSSTVDKAAGSASLSTMPSPAW